jgi:3-oxoadipate enol-lactonase
VLLIPGTGSDLRRAPGPFAWPGAGDFDLVSYDHRGLGRSVARDPAAQPSMADFAGDALALADELSWQRFALIGISFGGMVAQEIAIAAPERVERMVLACTSSGGAGGASAPLHEVLALPDRERAERMISLVDTRTATDSTLRAQMAERLAPVLGDPDEGLARQLEARRHHDTFERLGTVRAATLVAAGRYDALAPLENSHALAAAIPAARLEIFEGGHGFLDQDPRAWLAIAAFLEPMGVGAVCFEV